jgi:hypothetical protein
MRARKFKNKLIALNMIREFLVREKRFPSRGELAQIAQDNHVYDETWAPMVERLSTTDPDIINTIFNKLRTHLDIVFMYIQSYALEAADKFISSTVRLSRANRILDHVIADASDWARRVHDDNMCMIHRASMKLMNAIRPGTLSGTTINHGEGQLFLARHKSKRITVTDASISYSPENGKIKVTGRSTPSAILDPSHDTFFAGSIIAKGNTGIINLDLKFPHSKRFNIFDIDLVIPARVMLYIGDSLIADSGEENTSFQHTLSFRYIRTDQLRVQIHQPGAYREGSKSENNFQFGIRSISLTRCEYVATGEMQLESIYPAGAYEADYVAVEAHGNHAGEVTFGIDRIQGGLLKSEDTTWTINRNQIVTTDQDVELKRGEVYYLENSIFYPPKMINPAGNRDNSVEVSSDYNTLQEDTSSNFGIESVIDPIWGTKLWKFTRAAVAGANKNAIIPGSMRIVPALHTCNVQSYNLRRAADYTPMIEDWHMDSDKYSIAVHDSAAGYRKWLQDAEVLVKNGVELKDGMNIRIDMYIKAPVNINQNIIIYDIIGLQSAYYLDNVQLKTTEGTLTSLEDMFKPTQIPMVMKANKWHKLTILLYSSIANTGSAWDTNNLINPWNIAGNAIPVPDPVDTTDISENITQLYDFVVRNDIMVSGIGGEMTYVDLADLPFVSYPAYSMSDTHVYTNVNIDKKANHGATVLTWKEWKTDWNSSLDNWTSLMSMHNPSIVNSVDVSVNLTLMEQGLSPSVGDVIVLLGKKKAADPIIRYLTGDDNVQT